MTDRIPLFSLEMGEPEEAAVLEVLRERWLTLGPRTEAFESALAGLLGRPPDRAVAVANGTAALHLALDALGVGPGDEVIVPSLTFVASVNAVRYTGARPVLAEVIGEGDLTLDPEDAARRATPRTRAILPVHYAGWPCRMDAIAGAASERSLMVVEDAAHAPGATTAVGPAGASGDAGCFSFFGNKNMTTGEGGAAVFRDAEVARRARLKRGHGMTTGTLERDRGHAFSYDVVERGFNYRIDEVRAALGCVQIGRLAGWNERRRALTAQYRRLLAETPASVPFADRDLGESACHIMPVLLPEGADREGIMSAMRARGIQTSIHYPPVHLFTEVGRSLGTGPGDLPRTEAIAGRLLTLPLYPAMTDGQVARVAEELGGLLSKSS